MNSFKNRELKKFNCKFYRNQLSEKKEAPGLHKLYSFLSRNKDLQILQKQLENRNVPTIREQKQIRNHASKKT